MTDRVQALTVYLDDNYREDDAGELIAAISLLRGVASVNSTIVTSEATSGVRVSCMA